MLTRRFALLAAPALILARGAAADPAAVVPIRKLVDGLLAIMKAGHATPFPRRMAMIEPVVSSVFDLETILKTSIGAKWASIPDATKADLLAAFADFTAASWAANFDSFDGEKFDIAADSRPAGADQIVETKIIPKNDDPTRLDYVMRNINGAWRVVDILFNGSISEVARQRADFRASVAKGEGTLLQMLRQKAADLTAGAR